MLLGDELREGGRRQRLGALRVRRGHVSHGVIDSLLKEESQMEQSLRRRRGRELELVVVVVVIL